MTKQSPPPPPATHEQNVQATKTNSSNPPVALLLIISSVIWAFLPLVLNLSLAGETPIYFYFIYSISLVIGLSAYLCHRHKDHITMSRLGILRQDVKDLRREKSKSLWDRYSFHLSIIGRLGIAFYALSSSEEYAGTAVAAIIFESWVVWLVILRRIEGHSFNIGKLQTVILFLFSLVGIVFVNLAHQGISDNIVSDLLSPGMWIAIGAAILTAISIDRSLEFAKEISKNESEQPAEVDPKASSKHTELADSVLVILIAHVFIAILLGILFFGINLIANGSIFNFPEFSVQSTIIIAIYAGFLAPFTLIYPLKANIYTKSLEVNSIQYITPVLSIIILLVGTQISLSTNFVEDIAVQLSRFDFFLVGGVIILAVNLIFHFEAGGIHKDVAEKDFGYKALIIALWCSGVLVFYRDPILEHWFSFDESWLWEGTTDYFALLGLSSTIFILILSFRTLGLQERLRQEEHYAMSLYWKMKHMSQELPNSIVEIDRAIPGTELENAEIKIHQELNQYIDRDKTNCNNCLEQKSNFGLNAENIEITKMRIELSELVRSKQLGRNTTELMVLVGFAMATIFITIATRPGFITWNGFIIDLFSILFSSTIVYITYNLFEQRAKRNDTIFERKIFKKSAPFSKEPHNSNNIFQNDRSNVLIPSIVSICILLTFAFLLFVKWHETTEDFSWFSEICPTLSTDEATLDSGEGCLAHQIK